MTSLRELFYSHVGQCFSLWFYQSDTLKLQGHFIEGLALYSCLVALINKRFQSGCWGVGGLCSNTIITWHTCAHTHACAVKIDSHPYPRTGRVEVWTPATLCSQLCVTPNSRILTSIVAGHSMGGPRGCVEYETVYSHRTIDSVNKKYMTVVVCLHMFFWEKWCHVPLFFCRPSFTQLCTCSALSGLCSIHVSLLTNLSLPPYCSS